MEVNIQLKTNHKQYISMKSKIKSTVLLLILLVSIAACKSDDIKYKDAKITPVEDLYFPENESNIKLQTANGSNVLFQWAPALAEDGQVVMYEVLFYKESDKQKPVYRIPSDKVGSSPYANISHRDLNKVAYAAGIPTGESGTIYWTVSSSRGLNVLASPTVYSLTVKRLNGFADIPENVYITGTATESGDVLADAPSMRKMAEGEFEIYTEIDKEGSFVFVDKKSNDATKFYIDPAGELLFANDDKSSTVNKKGVYRITIDFNTGATTTTEITGIMVWHCWDGKALITLNYQGKGIWEGSTDKMSPSNKDDRYKIKMTTANGDEWWGPVNEGEDAKPSGNASYFHMALYPAKSQWDPKWKFANDPFDKPASAQVILQGEVYTHSITYN